MKKKSDDSVKISFFCLAAIWKSLLQSIPILMYNYYLYREIDVQSAEVTEEMERCKQSAMERRKAIEQEKECFQKAAYAVLDVLNIADNKQ